MKKIEKLQIAIAEDLKIDQDILIETINELKSEIGIAWVSDNGLDFLEKYQSENTKPHLVLLDCHMPFINGIELMKKIKEIYPEQKVILCSHACPKETDLRTISSYSNTWFSPKIPAVLTKMIEQAIQGIKAQPSISVDELWAYISSRYTLQTHDYLEVIHHLDEKELQILRLCSQNLTNSTMAHQMGMSYAKFNALKREIKQRLQLNTDADIYMFLQRHHLS
jgi:DNA-binding NarL/FixJ family response regulator